MIGEYIFAHCTWFYLFAGVNISCHMISQGASNCMFVYMDDIKSLRGCPRYSYFLLKYCHICVLHRKSYKLYIDGWQFPRFIPLEKYRIFIKSSTQIYRKHIPQFPARWWPLRNLMSFKHMVPFAKPRKSMLSNILVYVLMLLSFLWSAHTFQPTCFCWSNFPRLSVGQK